MSKPTVISKVTSHIEKLLGLNPVPDKNIYLGQSNIIHMQTKHPFDYLKYGTCISDILDHPDYVYQNPKDGSIEFVKEYSINNEFVKVAVRITSNDKYYARSLYILNNNRVNNYINSGKLKKV